MLEIFGYVSIIAILIIALAFSCWAWQKELNQRKYLDSIFDLQWAADMRGIKMWQAAGEGRELTWPDQGSLVAWLLEQLYNPHTEKPAHTDYAGWLQLMSDKGGKGVVNNIDARALGRVGNLIRSLEDTVAEHRREEDMGWCRALECAALLVEESNILPATSRAKLAVEIRNMKEE